jgi:hypothetical protein
MRSTLREAIEAWRERQEPGHHPALDELYEAVRLHTFGPELLEHLAACGRCAREVNDLTESVEHGVGLDLALPKAAATPVNSAVSLTTECGKYAVSVYPRPEGAMMAIEVIPAFAEILEGAVVTVTDRTGATLLSAPLVLGRASARIPDVSSLDLTRLVVRTQRHPA